MPSSGMLGRVDAILHSHRREQEPHGVTSKKTAFFIVRKDLFRDLIK
jgi:hypothetical protein